MTEQEVKRLRTMEKQRDWAVAALKEIGDKWFVGNLTVQDAYEFGAFAHRTAAEINKRR